MELFYPEQCICSEKIGNLIAAIIKYISSPVRMLSTSWIRMLIERHAVKSSKAMGVSREMCRYPVKNDTNSLAVHIIYKIHKVYCITVSAGWSIIIRNLISPGTIKWILRDSHKLDMGIAHVLNIVSDHRCKFSV